MLAQFLHESVAEVQDREIPPEKVNAAKACADNEVLDCRHLRHCDFVQRGQSENIFAVRGRIEGGGETLTLGAPVTGTISQVLVKAGIMFTPARAC